MPRVALFSRDRLPESGSSFLSLSIVRSFVQRWGRKLAYICSNLYNHHIVNHSEDFSIGEI